VDRLSLSTSLSANGLGPEFELQAQAYAPKRVGLVLDDRALASALRRALLTRTDLTETDESAAAVIIADHPVGELGIPAHAPVLIVGADRRPNPGESVIRSLDPALILAAAALVAGGHRIEPDARIDPDLGFTQLSAREKQVASLLVEGASNKLIARNLGISVHTAKFHVAAVLEKLGARNRADAVSIVLREGLVVV
jgi:DNA-binding CsgD family transcriptional regulator